MPPLNKIEAEKLEQLKKDLLGAPLTGDQVQSAILLAKGQGKKAHAEASGLSLTDSTQSWANAMNSRFRNTKLHRGFTYSCWQKGVYRHKQH